MPRRDYCSALAGLTAGLFPLTLLILGFVISARSPAAHAAPMEDVETAALTAQALASQDPIRVVFARRELRAWTRAHARLARARTAKERRQYAHQEEITQQGYCYCYEEVTPAARQLARLPVPDDE